MSLADLFMEPARPCDQALAKRVEPLGPWELPEQQRNGKGFTSVHPPEFLAGIHAGKVSLREALEAGMSSSRFYRIRKWGK